VGKKREKKKDVRVGLRQGKKKKKNFLPTRLERDAMGRRGGENRMCMLTLRGGREPSPNLKGEHRHSIRR